MQERHILILICFSLKKSNLNMKHNVDENEAENKPRSRRKLDFVECKQSRVNQKRANSICETNENNLSSGSIESSFQAACQGQFDMNLSENIQQQPIMDQLPNGNFLDIDDVVASLSSSDRIPFANVPNGKKENVYFLVDNSDNLKRMTNGRRCAFCDDCGAWSGKGGSAQYHYMYNENGISAVIYRRKGLYHAAKYAQGKKVFIPMTPQPNSNEVLVIWRSYETLKRCHNYKRRITRICRLPER